MVRLFKRLKPERVLPLVYQTFTDAQQSITEYIIDYYRQITPSQHNRGLSPNTAEQKCWISY